MNENLHPFEASGCGTGPFSFVGIATIPSPSLGEANPDAFNNALKALPKLDGGCGTCRHCGMAIMVICIVEDSRGRRFGVGSDCIEKVNDDSLGVPAKIAVQRRRREMARARREAKRQEERAAWLASPAGQDFTRKRDERIARHAAEKKLAQEKAAKLDFLKPLLQELSPRSGFCRSVLDGLNSEWPSLPFDRGMEILCDIWAKAHGRRGSKAFDDAVEDFESRLK
jgi:hypothetical protein